jgi:hypothetical protein
MKSGMRFVGRDDGKDGEWRKQEMVPEAGFYQSELVNRTLSRRITRRGARCSKQIYREKNSISWQVLSHGDSIQINGFGR